MPGAVMIACQTGGAERISVAAAGLLRERLYGTFPTFHVLEGPRSRRCGTESRLRIYDGLRSGKKTSGAPKRPLESVLPVKVFFKKLALLDSVFLTPQFSELFSSF